MAAKTTDPIDILLEMGIDLDNLSEEEDYLSALKEAIAKIQFQTKGAGDERSAILSQEVIKVRKSRKAADPKFKAKKTTVKPDAFFDKKKPDEVRQDVKSGAIDPSKLKFSSVDVAPKQKALPTSAITPYQAPEEEEGGKKKRAPRKSDPLKDILKSVNSIIEILKRQQKLSTKQADKDRKRAEKQKREGAENKLEDSGVKSFLSGAAKLVKPVKGFLDGLFDFIKNVLIGVILIKIIKWFTNPENQEKIEAIGDFFKNTWPILLAAYLLFGNSFGRFAVKLISTVGGFAFKLLRKLIPALLKGVARLGLGKSLALGGLAVGGGMLLGRMMDGGEDDKDLNQPDGKQKTPPPDKPAADGKDAPVPPVPADGKDGKDAPTPAPAEPEPPTVTGRFDLQAGQGYINDKPVSLEEYQAFQNMSSQEKAQKYATGMIGGGMVPGSGPNKDTIPAMLAPGEFVMSRGAVQKYGSDTMASMNAAGGGTNLPKRMNGITYAAGGGQIGDKPKSSVEKPHTENKDLEKKKAAKGSFNPGDMLGGLFGFGSDTKTEFKDPKQPPQAKKNADNAAKSKPAVASLNPGDMLGGLYGGFKSMFGFGGDDKGPVNDKDKPREGADGEEKQESSSTLSETQQKALQVLAKYESGAAGYDAVNQIGTKGGRGVEGFSGDIKKMPQHEGRSLTDFTLGEIKQLQYDDKTMTNSQWIKAGKLHAVGAYQFIGNTLPGVASRAGIPDTAKFTPAVQDLMALQLMKERGISPWVGPSDKATASERAIIEQARLEPISYDKTSGGGAITAFGGGGGGSYTPPGPGGGGPGGGGGPPSNYKVGSGIASLTGGKTASAGGSHSGTTMASLMGGKPPKAPSGPSEKSSSPPKASVSPSKSGKPSPPGPPPTSPPSGGPGGPMPGPGGPGGSQQGSSANSASKRSPNANNFPELDANAMISMEKVKVLGLTLA